MQNFACSLKAALVTTRGEGTSTFKSADTKTNRKNVEGKGIDNKELKLHTFLRPNREQVKKVLQDKAKLYTKLPSILHKNVLDAKVDSVLFSSRVKDFVLAPNPRPLQNDVKVFLRFSYVINVMIAITDPKDIEKRQRAESLIKRQQEKRRKRKEDAVLPIEWLHTKDGHHISSIDSLILHEDLVKETNRLGGYKKQPQQPDRNAIEGCLFDKNITKWEGTVKDIQRDWQGTINMRKVDFDVRFVPQNVQPSMPSTGDTVKFCLSFDRVGLMAWAVVRSPENSAPKSSLDTVASEEGSSDGSDDENNVEDENFVDTTIFNSAPRHAMAKPIWEDCNGQRKQGVVVSVNPQKGFGMLENTDVQGELFFHAAQLVKPVKSLRGTISKWMVLEFKVEQLTGRTRAADIHVLTVRITITLVQ